MLRDLLHRIIPRNPPPDAPPCSVTDDAERLTFERDERALDAKIQRLRVQRSMARLNERADKLRRKRRPDG